LLAGDADGNGVITVADFNVYANEISAISVYVTADFDLDGSVTVNDFNIYQPNASAIGISWVRY